MAKKIIILERNADADDYGYALWATVPDGRQAYYADAEFVSAYADASQEETAALRSGDMVELTGTLRTLPLSASATFDAMLAELVEQFAVFQSRIDAFDPYQHYGKYYDGTGWVEPGA